MRVEESKLLKKGEREKKKRKEGKHKEGVKDFGSGMKRQMTIHFFG